MNQLNDLIILLRQRFVEKSYDEIDKIIQEVGETKDSSCIELLIEFFDDDFEYEEIMYSIIHCIEDFDDLVYIKGLLNTIPGFIHRSPVWASIIHMRILNSKSTVKCYVNEVKSSTSDEQKLAIRKLLESINSVDSEFRAKTALILDYLS